MRLTELVIDPFAGFGEDDEPSAAELEGRKAMREILREAVQPENSQDMPEPVRAVLRRNLDVDA
jgi:hypothetical protein